MHKRSIVYRQVVRIKRICLIEEKLTNRLEQLRQWSVRRRYKEGHVDSEIERVKLVKTIASFKKPDKSLDDSITLVLTYYPALNQLYEILGRAHKHVLKLPKLHWALPSQSRVVFQNPKTNEIN